MSLEDFIGLQFFGCVDRGRVYVSFLRATSDCDRCTKHVHLRVTYSVEPRPCQGVISGVDALWDGVGEFVCSVTVWIWGEIAIRIFWTATYHGVYDLPIRLLSRFEVRRQ